MRKLKLFRKALTGEPNPRELIFEQIPRIFEADSLLEALKEVKDAKKDLDAHTRKLKKKAERVVRTTFDLPKDDDFLQMRYRLQDPLSSTLSRLPQAEAHIL